MKNSDLRTERLRKERDAAEHDKAIMQRLLNRAAAEIEDLADADCEENTKDRALQAARRFRRAATP
jgi:hypothetical protein